MNGHVARSCAVKKVERQRHQFELDTLSQPKLVKTKERCADVRQTWQTDNWPGLGLQAA